MDASAVGWEPRRSLCARHTRLNGINSPRQTPLVVARNSRTAQRGVTWLQEDVLLIMGGRA